MSSSKKYEKCKANTIKKIIKVYEKKKMSKKQSIAIALSIAEKGCKSKLSKTDIIKKEVKINNFIDNKNNKIKLSLITDYRLVYEYYIKKKKYINAINLQNAFMKKLLMLSYKNQLPESAYKGIMKK
jgi:hypothetical protein